MSGRERHRMYGRRVQNILVQKKRGEIQLITTFPLGKTFMAHLASHFYRLTSVFQKKGGVCGQKLAKHLEVSQEPVNRICNFSILKIHFCAFIIQGLTDQESSVTTKSSLHFGCEFSSGSRKENPTKSEVKCGRREGGEAKRVATRGPKRQRNKDVEPERKPGVSGEQRLAEARDSEKLRA
ncbi:hypothetical protein Q5P01_001165 [Channa striata]|uniref:Uncharacterized protein n=1 Tax=Channa striata TaxID=64152 RepID=A0AA88T3P1_CHASR|nr:hypothetical protein Q5P01_001165 [Channa striata]